MRRAGTIAERAEGVARTELPIHAEGQGLLGLVQRYAGHVLVIHLHFHPLLSRVVESVMTSSSKKLHRRGVEALALSHNCFFREYEEHRRVFAVSFGWHNTLFHIIYQRG